MTVVVVGGGISGLAAAYFLSQDGVAVTVIDSARELGGKLRTSEVGGVSVDEGAEAFLVRRPEAHDLVDRLGLAGELVNPRSTKAAIWSRGQLRQMPDRTVMGLPSDVGTLRGVLSSGELARVRADEWLPGDPPGEDISVGRWVRRRMGAAVVDRLIDPMLGGVYAGRADDLSLAATLPQLPRNERSALRAARRALLGSPSAGTPIFATLRGGLGALPAALTAAITRRGGMVIAGRTVRQIRRTETGWRVIHGSVDDELTLDAAAVICATPASAASRLLFTVAQSAGVELASIDSASLAIVTTAWRAGDVPAAGISGYLVPATYRRPVKAVTLSSAKWAHLNADGIVVARCSIGRHGEVTDLQRDDADLVAAAVAELTTFAGFRGAPIDSRVSRWGGALPQYSVGHLARVARIRSAVAAEPGLAVCGAAYDGVGIPACIATAQRAAADVAFFIKSRESR